MNLGSLDPANPIDAARGINDNGQVVGFSNVMGVGLTGWIWTKGQTGLTRLDTLLDPTSAANWTIQDCLGINNQGVIVASAFHPGANGTSRNAAVLLVPVPEPSTLAVLGGLSLVAIRRRRRS